MKRVGVLAVVLAALAGVVVGYEIHDPETTVVKKVQATDDPCAGLNAYMRAAEGCVGGYELP